MMKRAFLWAMCMALMLSVSAYATQREPQKEVKVRRVELSLEQAMVRVNQTRMLDAHIVPFDADDKDFFWESGNDEIAMVESDGTVIGISPGTVEIRAVSPSGRYGSCLVTVPDTIVPHRQKLSNRDIPASRFSGGETLWAAVVRVDVEDAVRSAPKDPSAVITYQDKTTVSTTALRAAAYTAAYEGGEVKLKFVTRDQNTVQGWLWLDPKDAPSDDIALDTRIFTDPEKTRDMQAKAAEQFGSAVVILLEQQGSFGMPVQVAAKADLRVLREGMTLYHYEKGKYLPLANQTYSVDADGLVHFTAERGGSIILA